MRWSLMDNAITETDKIELVKFILNSDRYTNGPKVKEFEQAWSDWLGCNHSLMVSSGSTANFLLLAAIKEKFNLKNGDKVLVPACTWVTNISPVFQLGFQPIFCDVNLENFSFDLEHLEQISKIFPDIKVIFVTHLLGYSAENEKYREFFPEAILLDDVCESHGCDSPDDIKRGNNSLGGTFSFYFGHHMTTIEGGMISTNSSDLYELMRMKRSHGLARESGNLEKYASQYPDIHSQFLFMTDGYNFRSSELNAVLGLSQLKRLNENIRIRRENFSEFISVMSDHEHLFYPVYNQEGNSNFAFPFISKEKETIVKLKKLFDENEIEHRPIVGGNLLRQPFLKKYTMITDNPNSTCFGAFGVPKSSYNVDTLHENGLYIGNSQFVTQKHLIKLARLLTQL